MSVQRYFHNKDEDIILRYPIHPIPDKAVPPVHTNENTLGQTLNNISIYIILGCEDCITIKEGECVWNIKTRLTLYRKTTVFVQRF